MANLRKETYGPGAMKGVNLVVIAYDNRVAKKDDVVATHYLDARIHPEDRRAAGQSTLALVARKDPKANSGYNNSARFSAGQFAAIKEAAGDNVTDLTDLENNVVGKIYGVKADLIVGNGGLIPNTKTLEASELSVQPDAEGRDIRSRIFENGRATKRAAEAEAAASAEASEVEATAAATDAPAVEPEAKTTAAKKAPAKRTPKPKLEPALVGAGAPVASTDEPGLG